MIFLLQEGILYFFSQNADGISPPKLLVFGVVWFYKLFRQFETQAQPAVGIIVCQHFEMSDFRRVLDMCSDTRAGVIIPDTDNAQRLACVFRQFAEIDDCPGFRFRHKFDCNRSEERR